MPQPSIVYIRPNFQTRIHSFFRDSERRPVTRHQIFNAPPPLHSSTSLGNQTNNQKITMARLLNSRCDFENGFFSCDLPEDAILLIVKVKTKSGNHTLVEDTEKRTEKFRPWKKLSKEGKQLSPKTSRSVNSQEK